MKTLLVFLLGATLTVGLSPTSPAQAPEQFYYWVTPRTSPSGSTSLRQSFVIQVDAATSAKIQAIWAKPGVPGFGGQIAVGSVDYNKDYLAPGQPVWNWHVTSVDDIFDFNEAIFPACQCPYLIANPSDIAANPGKWIADNGDTYVPLGYFISAAIDPTKPDALANVSNRAFTSAGEKVAITGFIISGGTPRSVIIRGLGPSLAGEGVLQFLPNPRIEVYHDSTLLIANDDWKTDANAGVIAHSFPSLVPVKAKEAALYLTLLPGAYTVQTSGDAANTEGVVLTEVYDANAP